MSATEQAPGSSADHETLAGEPVSLTGHTVPSDRLGTIGPHVAALAQTALAVSDRLPLGADANDIFRVLEQDAAQR